jgi:hypothetical protein
VRLEETELPVSPYAPSFLPQRAMIYRMLLQRALVVLSFVLALVIVVLLRTV